MAREALARGGGAATALNAANEVAVRGFLRGDIGFLDIVPIAERTVEALADGAPASLAEFVAVDKEAREMARGLIAGAGGRSRPAPS